MNPKLLRRLLVSVVAVGAFAGIYHHPQAPLLRIRLKDGTEIRVLKVAYGNNAHHEHELARPSELKRRLVHLLPLHWQDYFSLPSDAQIRRLDSYFKYQTQPAVSVWWAYDTAQAPADSQRPASKIHLSFGGTDGPRWIGHPAYIGDDDFQSFNGYSELFYSLAPNEPDLLVFQLRKPAKTLTVNFEINGQLVTFTVPIPALSE